jgi:hypothetical protein
MAVCCLGEFLIFSADKELEGGYKEKRKLGQDDRGGNGPKIGQSVLEGADEEEEEGPNRSRPLNDISYTKLTAFNKTGRNYHWRVAKDVVRSGFCLLEAFLANRLWVMLKTRIKFI